MNRLFPENSYTGNCSCGTDFIAPKGTLHCHNCLYNKIAELEEKLLAPTDSGVVALDTICEKFNSNKESNLHELTSSIWNKAFFEALKEQK